MCVCLTGVYLTSVCLIGVYLVVKPFHGAYVIGVCLRDEHLMSMTYKPEPYLHDSSNSSFYPHGTCKLDNDATSSSGE